MSEAPTVEATRRLLDQVGAIDIGVRCLDDGVEPSPLWLAQAKWRPNSRVLVLAERWTFGVAEDETQALLELAVAILRERLCPYCGRETMLVVVPAIQLDPDSDEGRAILAEEHERIMNGEPIDFDCWYEWNPEHSRFALHCIEGDEP